MSLQLNIVQKQFLNQEFEGMEWCPNCNMETDFNFNPMKDKSIICEHCGMEIMPCSLCDSGRTCEECKDGINASLLHFNELWDENVNGKY